MNFTERAKQKEKVMKNLYEALEIIEKIRLSYHIWTWQPWPLPESISKPTSEKDASFWPVRKFLARASIRLRCLAGEKTNSGMYVRLIKSRIKEYGRHPVGLASPTLVCEVIIAPVEEFLELKSTTKQKEVVKHCLQLALVRLDKNWHLNYMPSYHEHRRFLKKLAHEAIRRLS